MLSVWLWSWGADSQAFGLSHGRDEVAINRGGKRLEEQT